MSKFSQNLTSESSWISTWTMHKGEKVESHYHDMTQLVYPSAGIVSVITALGSWLIPPNKALLIPAFIEHEHRVYGAATMHTIQFSVEEMKATYTTPQVIAVNSLLKELIMAGSQLEDVDYKNEIFLAMKEIIIHYMVIDQKYSIHLPIPADQRLYEACNYIIFNMAVKMSLKDLGFALGFSERTLSRLFNTQMGMTYPQWRNQMRLYFALELLAKGKSIQYIAHKCGWSSSSSFIEIFRKYTGSTPAKFCY